MNWVNLSKKDILYTAIRFLLKDNPQFILDNKEKFDLEYKTAYTKDGTNSYVKYYVVDVLKNKELAKGLGLIE